jgi:hypothetical protein
LLKIAKQPKLNHLTLPQPVIEVMPEIELPLPEEGRDWTESKLFRYVYSITMGWIVEIGFV